ncbi:MAG: pyridoxamine 5'-phosphate oxidase family protein [Actinomycetota bacterium]|nr:pyridoxamine 5'-phosphate oxidase family protein [Actinomycetota bacterium]
MSDDGLKQQRRSRRIAMTDEERDTFLGSQRVCRVATVGSDGAPHVTPLWFVWDGSALWLNSIVRSQRWVDLQREPRIAIVVDGGQEYSDLCGVEIEGTVAVVGAVPRGSEISDELLPIERSFAAKYSQSDVYLPDGFHAWLRVQPSKITSWNFQKNEALRPPR